MNALKYSIAFSFILAVHFVQGQEVEPTGPLSIQQEFETIERKSTNYKSNGGIRYKVIRVSALEQIKAQIADSLTTSSQTINQLQNVITKHEKEVSALKSELDGTTRNLRAVSDEKDLMSLFGINMSKGTYKLIMAALILLLLLSLGLFVYKYRNGNFLTKQAKLALADVEQEFEQHRRRSLEREQKISRQLQDELNRNKKG